MFNRIKQEKVEALDEEYSRKYALYNPVSSAVEEWESSKGGLRAVEVWKEVLDLEKRLPKHHRMDRYISSEWTQLLQKYDSFMVWNGKEYVPQTTPRTEEEIERSVICILLVFAMRLGQYNDNCVNPYQPIIERIQRIALESRFPGMVLAITNALYDEEDREEEMGNVAPEEDVLAPYNNPVLSPEHQRLFEQLYPIAQFYKQVLDSKVPIGADFSKSSFTAIWDAIFRNEAILRQLNAFSSRVKNTLKDRHPKAPKSAIGNQYNLKMMMNIMGILLERKVLNGTIGQVRQLFFSDTKDEHFKAGRYADFNGGKSGLKNQEMLDVIYTIIEDKRNK